MADDKRNDARTADDARRPRVADLPKPEAEVREAVEESEQVKGGFTLKIGGKESF